MVDPQIDFVVREVMQKISSEAKNAVESDSSYRQSLALERILRYIREFQLVWEREVNNG